VRAHACPGGCGEEVAYARLSCVTCWLRLPRPIRDEINAAYRHRMQDRGRHIKAMYEAAKWYRANPLSDV